MYVVSIIHIYIYTYIYMFVCVCVRVNQYTNPLNVELNSICYLLALLAHHFSTLAG